MTDLVETRHKLSCRIEAGDVRALIGFVEESAIVVEGERVKVIDLGAVTIVDAEHVTHSNIAEAEPQQVLPIHN